MVDVSLSVLDNSLCNTDHILRHTFLAISLMYATSSSPSVCVCEQCPGCVELEAKLLATEAVQAAEQELLGNVSYPYLGG